MNRRIPGVGYKVETADGELLGAVAEVVGDYLKVYARGGEEYWLPTWDVTSCDSYIVRLGFSHQFLHEHQLDARVV